MKLIKIYDNKYLNVNLFSLTQIAEDSIELLGREKSQTIRGQIGKIWSKLLIYEREHPEVDLKDILIEKDSPLGQYILNEKRKSLIEGIDAYISFENIVSAYLTAIITDNDEMTKAIEPLLKSRVSGFINNISFEITSEMLSYIYENGNLESFLNNRKYETREFAVFENDNIRHLILHNKLGRK